LNAQPASRIRSISLFTATCIVIANMIGTGVFTSLGYQVGGLPTGFSIVVLWLVGGITALCGALVYGELAAALPRSGGEYHLLSATLHPSLGFLAGWLSVTVGFAAPVALAAMAFGTYFHDAWAVLPPVPLSIALVVVMTLIHLYGTKVGSAFQDASTVLKVALVVVLIVAGMLVQDAQPVSFLPHAGDWRLISSTSFAISLIYVMYAYTGWNATAYIVSEVRNPGRNVPLSVVLGTVIVTALYVLVNAVFMYATPLAELGKAGEQVAYVSAAHIFGHYGGKVMAALIAIGLISSVGAMTWIGPRVSVAMGEDWSLLGFLARRTRGGVPAVAILVQSAIVILLLVTSTFKTVLTYIQFSLTISSSLCVVGIFALRIRRPNLPRPCRCWGYPVTPLIFLAVNLWMIWFILQNEETRNPSLAGFGTMLLGLIIYAVSREKPKRADFEALHETPADELNIDKIALSSTPMQTAPPQP
jgi:APA family basic amino acid/polyamine antiporter